MKSAANRASRAKTAPTCSSQANRPTETGLVSTGSFGDEYEWKIFWLKKDGIWYREPGGTFPPFIVERKESEAGRLGAEVLRRGITSWKNPQWERCGSTHRPRITEIFREDFSIERVRAETKSRLSSAQLIDRSVGYRIAGGLRRKKIL
jgi:hypothetical protein